MVTYRANNGEYYNLKFYADEINEFEHEYQIMIPTQHELKKIVQKICRHFKIRKPSKIVFTKHKGNTGTCTDSRILKFHKEVFSFGITAHEITHLWLDEWMYRGGTKCHTKKTMSKIRRILKYCAKMNYWGHYDEYLQYKHDGGQMNKETYEHRIKEILKEHKDHRQYLMTYGIEAQ